jgi:hypothetical protein
MIFKRKNVIKTKQRNKSSESTTLACSCTRLKIFTRNIFTHFRSYTETPSEKKKKKQKTKTKTKVPLGNLTARHFLI